MAGVGVAGGRSTESMVAPTRVAVTGGSWTTSSETTVLAASRRMTRCGLVLTSDRPSAFTSGLASYWNVPT